MFFGKKSHSGLLFAMQTCVCGKRCSWGKHCSCGKHCLHNRYLFVRRTVSVANTVFTADVCTMSGVHCKHVCAGDIYSCGKQCPWQILFAWQTFVCTVNSVRGENCLRNGHLFMWRTVSTANTVCVVNIWVILLNLLQPVHEICQNLLFVIAPLFVLIESIFHELSFQYLA